MKDVNLIKLHPIKDSEYFLLIHEMRKKDIDEWINKHYSASKINNTTDSHWNWKTIYYHMAIQNSLGQKIKGYVYRINGEIYGISIVAYNYPCILNIDNKKIKPYLWYMVKSSNSTKNLLDIGINPKHVRLQKYVYDIINDEIRFNHLDDGFKTFWLHADPIGNSRLLENYIKQGFSTCILNQDKVLKARKDDGRYMYFPEIKFKELFIPTVRR